MSFLVTPRSKARRLELFTNTYEVTDDFGVRKSDFFYLVENEKIVIICFCSEIRKIIEDETMTER